jgi:hypothetical protein
MRVPERPEILSATVAFAGGENNGTVNGFRQGKKQQSFSRHKHTKKDYRVI